MCLFSSPATVRCFVLIKSEGLDLKFDLLGLRACLRACFLIPGSSDVSLSLKEKVLTWNVDLQD